MDVISEYESDRDVRVRDSHHIQFLRGTPMRVLEELPRIRRERRNKYNNISQLIENKVNIQSGIPEIIGSTQTISHRRSRNYRYRIKRSTINAPMDRSMLRNQTANSIGYRFPGTLKLWIRLSAKNTNKVVVHRIIPTRHEQNQQICTWSNHFHIFKKRYDVTTNQVNCVR